MSSSLKRISWLNVVCFLIVVAFISGSAVVAPILAHKLQVANQARNVPVPTLQQKIEDGSFLFGDAESFDAFPYESISLERTPCMGDCPIYVVTFYKNGRATLVTDSWSKERQQTFTGELSPYDFARLCQMVNSAREATKSRDFKGGWTDFYSAIVVARTKTGTWRVSDNGQVSPLPVWALAEKLHSYRQSIEWHPSST